LVPILFGVDIFEEIPKLIDRKIRLVLLKPVYEEMKRLSRESKLKVRKNLISALELCKGKCDIIDLDKQEGEDVDDVLIRTAEQLRCLVATNDSNLKQRLREKGIPIIYLRQRAYLSVDGWIQN
jgi:rRNA-processing protein FCF1